MHSIKRAARRQAWYPSDDGVGAYNPFGRMNPRRRRGADEEDPLHLTQSAPGLPPTDANGASFDGNIHQGHPNHPNTFPSGPEGNETSPVDRDIPDFEKKGVSHPSSNTAESIPSRSIEESAGPSGENGKPRKRKRAFFTKFGGKDKEQNELSSEEHDAEKPKSKWALTHSGITVTSQLRAVFMSWINLLLVFVPVGIALEYAHINKVVVFVINFIAIVPLAAMLSYATEELAMYIGEVLGGLLNATFGNAVELIVSVIALTQGKVLIVKTSLIGSMLSNLLLVLGMCFFLGGINRLEQHFNITVAQTAASLLALAIGALIIPTAFQIFSITDEGVNPTSRGTSVLLLVVYACYLIFQLRTHVDMYNEPSQKTPKRSSGKKQEGEAAKGIAMIGAASGAASAGGALNRENLVQEQPEDEETPNLTLLGAIITLIFSTVLIALCAEYMVSAIGEVSQNVSQEFIGLILLPIVGNAAEHATAVTVAIKDKMDLSIGVAVGSSLQIALLVMPIMVLLSWWGVGRQYPEVMNLDFDGFLVVVLVLAIWLVNYLINDGKSHWLEGVLLMICYLIIAISAWFYPVPEGEELAG